MAPDPQATESAKAKLDRRPHAPKLEVALSASLIDAAEVRSSSHCMWAEAVKLAAPWAQSVSVDLQTIRITDPVKRLRYIYLTPRKAQVSLIRFDQGLHTDPNLKITLRDGQVTKAANYEGRAPRKSRSRRGPDGTMPAGHKAVLAMASVDSPEGVHNVRKVGGKPPPLGPLTNAAYRGKRRAFGLRQLEA